MSRGSIRVGDVVVLRVQAGYAIDREMDVVGVQPLAAEPDVVTCVWKGKTPLFKGASRCGAFWSSELRVIARPDMDPA